MLNPKISLPCFFCLVIGLCAQPFYGQTPQTSEKKESQMNAVSQTTNDTDDSYLISPGDILEVRVFNRPQFSRDAVRVSEEGRIRMPFIENEIEVACQTERELAEKLTEILKEYIRTPQVDVMIKEYQSLPVAVLGAVRSPSRLQLQRRRQIRLLEVLAFVGGPSEKAGRTLQLIRNRKNSTCPAEVRAANSNETENDVAGATAFYKLEETLDGDSVANPLVGPGDIIILPEADQAFIVGNVVSPRTLILQEPLTITQAIAMAGGLLPDTKRDRIRIVRQQPAGSGREEIFVDLKAIEKRKMEDVVLQPNDIIDVPVSGGKRLLRSFIGAIVPSVGQLPVRVIP